MNVQYFFLKKKNQAVRVAHSGEQRSWQGLFSWKGSWFVMGSTENSRVTESALCRRLTRRMMDQRWTLSCPAAVPRLKTNALKRPFFPPPGTKHLSSGGGRDASVDFKSRERNLWQLRWKGMSRLPIWKQSIKSIQNFKGRLIKKRQWCTNIPLLRPAASCLELSDMRRSSVLSIQQKYIYI